MNTEEDGYLPLHHPDAPMWELEPNTKQLPPLPVGLPARPSGPPPLGTGRNHVLNGGGAFLPRQRRPYNGFGAADGPPHDGGSLNYG